MWRRVWSYMPIAVNDPGSEYGAAERNQLSRYIRGQGLFLMRERIKLRKAFVIFAKRRRQVCDVANISV
jgi:hypothetical protein